MKKENQAALILEGGGNRGVFTAGVLDYLMEQNTECSGFCLKTERTDTAVHDSGR